MIVAMMMLMIVPVIVRERGTVGGGDDRGRDPGALN
jgi:hypothetical protein